MVKPLPMQPTPGELDRLVANERERQCAACDRTFRLVDLREALGQTYPYPKLCVPCQRVYDRQLLSQLGKPNTAQITGGGARLIASPEETVEESPEWRRWWEDRQERKTEAAQVFGKMAPAVAARSMADDERVVGAGNKWLFR